MTDVGSVYNKGYFKKRTFISLTVSKKQKQNRNKPTSIVMFVINIDVHSREFLIASNDVTKSRTTTGKMNFHTSMVRCF